MCNSFLEIQVLNDGLYFNIENSYYLENISNIESHVASKIRLKKSISTYENFNQKFSFDTFHNFEEEESSMLSFLKEKETIDFLNLVEKEKFLIDEINDLYSDYGIYDDEIFFDIPRGIDYSKIHEETYGDEYRKEYDKIFPDKYLKIHDINIKNKIDCYKKEIIITRDFILSKLSYFSTNDKILIQMKINYEKYYNEINNIIDDIIPLYLMKYDVGENGKKYSKTYDKVTELCNITKKKYDDLMMFIEDYCDE
jgi:hypothetical protein